MKGTILAATIVATLAGPAPVLAEEPAVTLQPAGLETTSVDVESDTQQAAGGTLREVEAAITELTGQQAEAGASSETATPVAEPQMESEAAAPAIEMAGEQALPEAPSGVAAAGAAGTGTARAPCRMQGKAMRHRGGMGKDGKGPGGGKPVCGCRGKGQHNKHEQVVRRLDMIEARMAKIEAMLESLMQR